MDTFLQTQLGINIAFQQIGGLTPVAQLLSFFGIAEFFLVVIATIYLAISPRLGARFMIFSLIGAEVNSWLKIFFHSPRPYWLSTDVKALASEASYGLPSGHAQIAASAWLYVAREVQKNWAWVVAGVMIVLISFSRIYLGVHFLSDVVGGWVVGLVVLGGYVWLEERVAKWLSALPTLGQIGSAFAFALVIVGVGLVVNTAVAASPDPAAWSSFSHEARSLDSIIGNAGALFGVGVGLVMMNKFAKFSPSARLWQKVVCVLLGIVGVLALQAGLGAVLPRGENVVGGVFRFARYAVMLWWLMFATPWVGLKLKLMQ